LPRGGFDLVGLVPVVNLSLENHSRALGPNIDAPSLQSCTTHQGFSDFLLYVSWSRLRQRDHPNLVRDTKDSVQSVYRSFRFLFLEDQIPGVEAPLIKLSSLG
jgi:hypothetical protein